MLPDMTWLQDYSLDIRQIRSFGGGLINQTFQIDTEQGIYIGQQLNTHVFPFPDRIATNVRTAANFLAHHDEEYLFLAPILTKAGKDWSVWDGRYWRLTPFVPQSYTVSVVDSPSMAYAAAQGFGTLTQKLDGLELQTLQETIPQFHYLPLRIEQAQEALRETTQERRQLANSLEKLFDKYRVIGDQFDRFWQHADIPRRLLHHDTKISNILFKEGTEDVLAVCDLDTLMPGIILSDLGDMVRTYACNLNEESTDWTHLQIRPDTYAALHQGYVQQLNDVLTSTEREALFWAGPCLLYMQAVRFLADYWMGDPYYKTTHALHNLHRAQNQFILLQQIMDQPGYWRGLILS